MKPVTRNILLLCLLLFAIYPASRAQGILEGAKWISAPLSDTNDAMPIFRRQIHITKDVRQAMLTSSALGIYQICARGYDDNDDVMKPGWTDYRNEVQYQQQEIKAQLKSGDDYVIVAQLSHGWWIGGITRGVYGKKNVPHFICRLDLEYADGTKESIGTDSSWLCSTDGALVMGDIYNGETYDARKPTLSEMARSDYDTSSWSHSSVDDIKISFVPEVGPKVKVRQWLERNVEKATVYDGNVATETKYGKINILASYNKFPKRLTLKKGQTLLLDFGQNMVGWIRMKSKGASGTTVTCKVGEMLNYSGDSARLDNGPAGSLWRYNLRSAKATMKYTLRGGDAETYHPNHSYFGFRYAELTTTDDVEIEDVRAMVVGSDLTEWGKFSCSNKDINQLYSNVWWGQRGNFLSIPTDCPQRDERLGWTGDTQIFSTTALYNSDAKDFYRKWMGDMRACQRKDGAYPETAPFANMWGYGTAAWGDAGIIVPWNVYLMTGDMQIISENWDSMNKWMHFCESQKEEGWSYIGAEPKCGDWLAYKTVEPRYVSYAYFAYSATLMAKMARVLGHNDDAIHYLTLLNDIKQEFRRRYMKDGNIAKDTDTQTAYLLALHFNLIDDSERQAAIESLRTNIISNGYKLSTGFVGTGILMQTLTECGMTDIAYRLLLQRENPSWLYSIDQGATTVWERWDSYTIKDGFNKHPWNMNSFNHYSYGAVVEWFYSGILGIQPDEDAPGFKHIILDPQFGGGLTSAKGGTMTPYGRVDVEWKQTKDGIYHYAFNIPKGTSASLTFNGKTHVFAAGKHNVEIIKNNGLQ